MIKIPMYSYGEYQNTVSWCREHLAEEKIGFNTTWVTIKITPPEEVASGYRVFCYIGFNNEADATWFCLSRKNAPVV